MAPVMETGTPGSAPSSETNTLERGISPSDALNRFEPPEGFLPAMLDAPMKQQRYGFRSAGLGLLIRPGIGSEAVPMMPLAAIPNGPSWLLGMINLRGNLVPVCDLRRLVGGASDAALEKPMILVLDKGEQAAGFLIDGYPVALTALRPANQLPGLPQPLERHVKTLISADEEVWLEFDHEGFLEEAVQ